MTKRSTKTPHLCALPTNKRRDARPSVDDRRVAALSRALARSDDDDKLALIELLVEQYPDYLHGWFHQAFSAGENLDAFVQLCSKLNEFGEKHPSPEQFGFQAEMYGEACELCADEFMKMDLPNDAIVFYRGALQARPERCSDLTWRIASALIRVKELDEAENALNATYDKQDTSLFVFATRTLLLLARESGSECFQATRLATLGALQDKNKYLYEYLVGDRALNFSSRRRVSKPRPGSQSEVTWYLQLTISTWDEYDSPNDYAVKLLDDMRSEWHTPIPINTLTQEKTPTLAEIRTAIDRTNFSNPVIRHRLNVVKTPELWSYFFAVARKWYEAKVWKTVGEEAPFEITLKDSDEYYPPSLPRVVSIMGALGKSFGAHVFDSPFDAQLFMDNDPLLPEVIRSREVGLFCSVAFEFVPAHELLEENRCLLSAFKVEPVGPKKLVPDIRRYFRGYAPTLPDELTLIIVLNTIVISLGLDESIKSGNNPWKKARDRQTLNIASSPPPEIAKLLPTASCVELPPAPDLEGSRFNRMDLTKTLSRAKSSGEEWDIGWTYLPSWISGNKDIPDHRVCFLILTERTSGAVLGHTDVPPSGALIKSIATLLIDIVKRAGFKPKRLFFDESIDLDTMGPVLKTCGVEAITEFMPASVMQALSDLFEHMNDRAQDLT